VCEGEREGEREGEGHSSLSLSPYFAYSACLGSAIWENATEGIVGGEKKTRIRQEHAARGAARVCDHNTSEKKLITEEEEERWRR